MRIPGYHHCPPCSQSSIETKYFPVFLVHPGIGQVHRGGCTLQCSAATCAGQVGAHSTRSTSGVLCPCWGGGGAGSGASPGAGCRPAAEEQPVGRAGGAPCGSAWRGGRPPGAVLRLLVGRPSGCCARPPGLGCVRPVWLTPLVVRWLLEASRCFQWLQCWALWKPPLRHVGKQQVPWRSRPHTLPITRASIMCSTYIHWDA